MKQDFLDLLSPLSVITLDEMSSIRLMNRTDQKYLATEPQLLELLSMVKEDYMVQVVEGCPYSYYNTVYLDDADNSMYLSHHNGRLTRQKVRVRTYIDTETSFFEMKFKNNRGRTKKKRILLDYADSFNQNAAVELFNKYSKLDLPFSELSPKMENFFERITLVNREKTERITIDTGLLFNNFGTELKKEMNNLVIIEVKRDGYNYSPMVHILKELRIRPSGFSKYCIGSAITNPDLKANRFKIRLRKIDKMINN